MDADDLLMDEPLSNLDALLRLNFRSELKKIVKDLKTTTVYVTHDQSEALSLGDRVAVMRKGQIAQLGDLLDVYDAPADRFVGGFIGSPPMNFIKTAVSGDGGALIVCDQRLRAPSLLQSYSSTDVLLGVRAENVAGDSQRSSGDVPGNGRGGRTDGFLDPAHGGGGGPDHQGPGTAAQAWSAAAALDWIGAPGGTSPDTPS